MAGMALNSPVPDEELPETVEEFAAVSELETARFQKAVWDCLGSKDVNEVNAATWAVLAF